MLTPPFPPGLDDSLQDYPFEGWELPGKYLLQLCPHSLEALTVWPLGHQELILQGVEQLQALVSKQWPHWLPLPPTWGLLVGVGHCQKVTCPLSGTELRATDTEPTEPDREAAGEDPCPPELSAGPPVECRAPSQCPQQSCGAGACGPYPPLLAQQVPWASPSAQGGVTGDRTLLVLVLLQGLGEKNGA